MRSTITLGRIGSIELALNWSLLPLAGILWWLLAFQLLPAASPFSPEATLWPTAVVVVIGFYASLLGHELCHAAVARRRGMGVDRIVLWLLGGMAELRSDARRAGDEVLMAAAGPAGSLALAVVSWLVALGLAHAGASALPVAAALWLARANLVLAVFNMVPAFPLDGGRVLRGLLWWLRGQRRWATTVAARVGQLIGAGMLVYGFTSSFHGGSAFGGPWLMVVGGFIVAAAGAQLRTLGPVIGLDGRRVGDVMTIQPFTAPATASVQALVERWVRTCPFSSLPLVDEQGRLAGLATVARVEAVAPSWWPYVAAGAVAVPLDQVVVCQAGDDLAEVALRMLDAPEHRAVVVEDGHPIGILAPSDVVRAQASAPAPARPLRYRLQHHGSSV